MHLLDSIDGIKSVLLPWLGARPLNTTAEKHKVSKMGDRTAFFYG
jgi:hypothetical protein